jgi:hypothetical protein
MERTYVDRAAIEAFLTRLGTTFAQPGRLYLVGETTQVYEGWRERTPRLEFAAEVAPKDHAAFAEAVHNLRSWIKIEMFEESPGDVIPLPAGHAARARSIGKFGGLWVYHFDPYSVAFRLIARGDEPDYHAVIVFLQHDWLTVDEMNARLTNLLPQFTNETLQQDPAEFRRKFRGLLQMWQAARPREPEVER